MAMTKTEISRFLAEKTGITKKQSDAMLEALAELAYAEAKNTFVVPGLGKLSLKESAAREATMPFGPRKGEKYMVPAKQKIKFTVSKAAKDAIAGAKSAGGQTASLGDLEGDEDYGKDKEPTDAPADQEEAALEGDEDFGDDR